MSIQRLPFVPGNLLCQGDLLSVPAFCLDYTHKMISKKNNKDRETYSSTTNFSYSHPIRMIITNDNKY